MKIEVVAERRDETGTYLTIECSRDGQCVQKRFRMSGDKQDNGRTFAKYVREADRDIAYRLHGDWFRDHCEYKTPFWDLLPKDEFERLVALL